MIRLRRANFGRAFSIPSNWRGRTRICRKGRLPDTREIVAHPNYIVVYRVRRGRIQVLSVVHARREYPPAQ